MVLHLLYYYHHKRDFLYYFCAITSRIFLLIPIFYQIRNTKGTSESQRNAGKKERAFFLVPTSGDIILFYLFIYDRITLGFLLFVYIMLFLLENLGLLFAFFYDNHQICLFFVVLHHVKDTRN